MSPIVKKLKTWGLDDRKYSISIKFLTVIFCLISFALIAFFALYPVSTWFHQIIATGERIPYPNLDDAIKIAIPSLVCIIMYFIAFFMGLVTIRDTGNLFFVSVNYTFFVGVILSLLAQSGLFVVIGKHLDYFPFEFAWKHIYALKWQYLVYGGVGVTAFLSLCVTRLFTFSSSSEEDEPTSGKLGSAKQADINYLDGHNLVLNTQAAKNKEGHIIGIKDNKYIALPELNIHRHTLLVAPGRSGKTSSLVIPRILDANENVFVLDLKSELFQTTYQESIRKGKIPVAIDPYNVLSHYGDFERFRVPHYDPLNPQGIDLGNRIRRDQYIDSVVAALTVSAKFESTHFADAAKATLGAILDDYIGSGKTLVSLHDTYAPMNQKETIDELQRIEKSSDSRRAMSAMGLLRKVGDREAGSMLSTLYRSFDYVAAHVWSEFFGKPGINLSDCIEDNYDFYWIIPKKMAENYHKVVRLILQMFMVNFELVNQKKIAGRKFQVILDETYILETSSREIEQMIDFYGEKGVCVTLIFQTISQIDKFTSPDLITGLDLMQIYATNNLRTIEWVRRLGGRKTIVNTSRNTSSSKNNQSGKLLSGRNSSSVSENSGEIATDLYHDNEIRELAHERQFIFMKGIRSFICNRVFYLHDKRYQGRFGINYVEEKGLIELLKD